MKNILLTGSLALFTYCAQAQNVVLAEYFIDTDAGIGQNTLVTLTPAPDGSFPFTANLANVDPGYHMLYVRTKDDNGNWGHTIWRSIEVIKNTAQANVATIEYFFDTDPGFGNGSTVTIPNPLADGTFNFKIPFNQVTTGNKKLFVRVKDSDTAQSITTWKDVTITIGTDNIADAQKGSLHVYPNPSAGLLTVDGLPVETGACTLSVTDLSGRVLQSVSTKEKQASLLLNYPSGTYILGVVQGNTFITKTITIQKR